MIFLKSNASRSFGRVALAALCLAAGGTALATLPVIGIAHADHGQGGGHDKGGHESGSRHDNDGGHDNRGPGSGPGRHDDGTGHDVDDDHGGLAGNGADDPANHDANDDHGDDGTVIPASSAAN
jgi:hypothetical protein